MTLKNIVRIDVVERRLAKEHDILFYKVGEAFVASLGEQEGRLRRVHKFDGWVTERGEAVAKFAHLVLQEDERLADRYGWNY